MLISKNKKNNIAKSIALMLALVLAISCVLTACADKTARADVEDLKGAVDTLNKDVETVTGKVEDANKVNVTTEALAEVLADYLKTQDLATNVAEILKEYEKTEDAHKFVTDLLTGYVTKEALDAALAGYYKKEAIDALLTEYVKKADLNGFIADFIGSDTGKDAVIDAIDDVFMKTEDYEAATAEVLAALLNFTSISEKAEDNIYTVADWATYEALMLEYLNIDYAAIRNAADADAANKAEEAATMQYLNYAIALLRATNADDFDVLDELKAKIDVIPTAADAIAAINAKIDALATASEGKIDSADAAALAEIKGLIAKFDADYGFNATSVTVTMETTAFETGFVAGPDLDDDALAAKMIVNNYYTTNNDYITEGGLKLAAFCDMLERYDFLMGWAADIDEMIVDLVATITETDKGLTDAERQMIQNVVLEIEGDETATGDDKLGFVAANNGITDPIENYDTYVYYAWLEGKLSFDETKADAKAELDEYAADAANKFDSANMNAENAQIVIDAKDAIDNAVELKYSSFKTAAEAKAALDAKVAETKAAIDEVVAKYSFPQAQLGAIAAIEEFKATLKDTADIVKAIYTDIADRADALAADIAAVVPALEDETVKYPYTAALALVNSKKAAAITELELMKAKVDAKEAVADHAEAYLAGGANAIFFGTEVNYDEVVAYVVAAAKATYKSIEDAADVAAVATAKDAALKAVDEAAYFQLLNLKIADIQTKITDTFKAAKTANFEKANAIGDLANPAVLAARKSGNDNYKLTETVTTWADAYTAAAAKVDEVFAAFNAETVVAEFLATQLI